MGEPVTFTDEERQTLRQIARGSIAHGLTHRRPMPVDPSEYPPSLQAKLAVFVTLHLGTELRGCIGNTIPVASLVQDTAEHAYAAAFRDPRFGPLAEHEFARLDIKLSVLTPPTPVHVDSEAELLERLQVGVDGLILRSGQQRATFLPSVWETLPDPTAFLAHLKMKAGLTPDAWPDDLQIERYAAIAV